MANFDMQELSRTIIEELSVKSPLQHEYSWAVSDATWSKLPTGFDHTSLKDPERNIALKRHLAQCWAAADDGRKYEIANWVVRDWGGVRLSHPLQNRDARRMSASPPIASGFANIPSGNGAAGPALPDWSEMAGQL